MAFERNVRVEKNNHMRSESRQMISFFSTLLFQLDKLKDQFITTKHQCLDKLISLQNLKTTIKFSSLPLAILETRKSTKTLYKR